MEDGVVDEAPVHAPSTAPLSRLARTERGGMRRVVEVRVDRPSWPALRAGSASYIYGECATDKRTS